MSERKWEEIALISCITVTVMVTIFLIVLIIGQSEKPRSDLPETFVPERYLVDGKEVKTFLLNDGTRCAIYNPGGIDCDWVRN